MFDLAIRPAQGNETEVRKIYDLLARMFEESALQPLNPVKAMVEIERVCREEAAWIVVEGDRIVATVGLVRGAYWYSDAPILVTRWLYALPEHRGAKGAWGMMLNEVTHLVAAVDMTAMLDVYNPKKERRAGRVETGMSRFACEPRGARLIVPALEKEMA